MASASHVLWTIGREWFPGSWGASGGGWCCAVVESVWWAVCRGQGGKGVWRARGSGLGAGMAIVYTRCLPRLPASPLLFLSSFFCRPLLLCTASRGSAPWSSFLCVLSLFSPSSLAVVLSVVLASPARHQQVFFSSAVTCAAPHVIINPIVAHFNASHIFVLFEVLCDHITVLLSIAKHIYEIFLSSMAQVDYSPNLLTTRFCLSYFGSRAQDRLSC